MDKYKNIIGELRKTNTVLVAVSKTKPVSAIMEMYDAGQRIFGENRAIELRDKAKELPKDIEWHMIGHLQSNKIKYILPFVSMIESIDRKSLLEKVNQEALKNNRIIDILLQIKIAEEESKYGLDMNEATDISAQIKNESYPGIRCRGVMGMATLVEDEKQVRKEFRKLRTSFDQLREDYFFDHPNFDTVSMGMSGDYRIAIQEGSTMVRIGSLLFGTRNQF